DGLTGNSAQDIFMASATTSAGPRVISGTMGPVASLTVDGTTFNNTFTSDGIQLANAIEVEFDRPIDPASFTRDQATVIFRSPSLPLSSPGLPLNVINVTDLNPAPAGTVQAGSDTRFLVRFDPSLAGLPVSQGGGGGFVG